MPLALRLSEGLGRIRTEDFIDFHAQQALEPRQIKVHAWELFSQRFSGPNLRFGTLS